MKNNYQLITGLEVHAELKTKSKMFCGCKNDPFGAEKPNIYTCPVCLGMPGGLPVPNQTAIEWTLKLGLALNCKVNLFSKFDRKHYFYPDLPKGYQISQYDLPFCENGYLDTSEGRVKIRRIHLEEDTGKLLHTDIDGKKVTLVDFNRGGVPLIEIVTEPDIKSASQAAEYAKKLRDLIRYLQIGDCDMQKGGMRLEANLSLSPDGQLPSYKVEVKNINSFRFMQQAIEYEIKRQTKILEKGETPSQETRGYNPQTGETFSQRSKEEAEDYRYFPDPDIPPLKFSKAEIEKIKNALPELLDQVSSRWESAFGVELRWSQHLITNQSTVQLIEAVFELAKTKKIEPNSIATELVNKNIALAANPQIMIEDYQKLFKTDQVSDHELAQAISLVLSENPDAVEKIKAGQNQVIGFLLGQITQKIDKKLDMKAIRTALVRELKK